MSHRIQKQILALDIPSGNDSWRFQNQMRDTFNEEVLPRFEKVCDELGIGDGTVLKIDSLLLDTGVMSQQELATDWANQVEAQFREQLKRLKNKGPEIAEKVELQTSEQSNLNLALHFLNLGVLPWWAKNHQSIDISTIINQLMIKQSTSFVARLKKLRNRELVVTRILKLLSPEALPQFRASLNAVKPLKPVLEKLGQELKVHLSQAAWQRLEVEEIIQHFHGPASATEESIFYHWLYKEIKISPTTRSVVFKAYKKLKVKNLESFKKINNQSKEANSSLSHSTLAQALLKALQRLEETLPSVLGETGVDPVEVLAEASAESKRKTQSPQKSNTQSNQEDPAQKDSSESTTNENQQRAINKENTVGRRTTDKEKQEPSAEVDSTQDGQIQAQENDASMPSQSQRFDSKSFPGNPNRQDEHVFNQLARIRKAVLERQQQAAEEESETQLSQAAATDSPETQASTTDAQMAQPLKPADSTEKRRTNTEDQLKQSSTTSQDPQSAPDVNQPSPESVLSQDQKAAVIQRTETREVDPVKVPGPNSGTWHQKGSHTADQRPFYPYDLSGLEQVEECYIENAGLVLFWPFLGRFFKNLVLVENSAFISLESQEKAACLLQHLLGDTPSLEDFALPLNKLMCNLPIEHPISQEWPLSETEKEHINDLLQSTISNWSTLKGTSIPGFQGSFLNRAGVLKKRENGWLLQVEKMAFDMLLEQLPWPVSIVRFSWMNEPIYVEW